MLVSLDSEIHAYAAMVDHIAAYEDDDEVIYALHWRDAIQRDLQGEACPDPSLLAVLRAADDLLLRQQAQIVSRFPDVFHADRRRNKSRDRWWWYLDEGPQVREKAEEAA